MYIAVEKRKNLSIYSFFIYLIIILFSTEPSFILGQGNKNLLLIGFMVLSIYILFIFILEHKKIFQLDILLIAYLMLIVSFTIFFNADTMRWSTILYSYLFIFTFMVFEHVLYYSDFSSFDYLNLLKAIIYAYFFVLLIQQVCVLLGLPIFMVSSYDPSTPFKLNSLSAEPSHSARIVPLLFYSYIVVKEHTLGRKYLFKDIGSEKFLWFSFLWTMITMESGTAFIFLLVIFLRFLNVKNIIIFILIALVVSLILKDMHFAPVDRAYKFLSAIFTLDSDFILETDHSGALRVVPIMILADLVDVSTFSGLFGNGIDYVSTFLWRYIPGVPQGITGGGMLLVWMEYGFISFMIFIIFSLLATFDSKNLLSLFFWFILVFMYGINNQIVWLVIMILYLNKYFLSRSENARK